MPDQQGHELGVGGEVQYFLDDFTVCDVTILCIEADGNYLVQRDATFPVRHLPPHARSRPTKPVLLEDVLTGAVPAPVSSWEEVTDHGLPDTPFVVPGRSLSKPILG